MRAERGLARVVCMGSATIILCAGRACPVFLQDISHDSFSLSPVVDCCQQPRRAPCHRERLGCAHWADARRISAGRCFAANAKVTLARNSDRMRQYEHPDSDSMDSHVVCGRLSSFPHRQCAQAPFGEQNPAFAPQPVRPLAHTILSSSCTFPCAPCAAQRLHYQVHRFACSWALPCWKWELCACSTSATS